GQSSDIGPSDRVESQIGAPAEPAAAHRGRPVVARPGILLAVLFIAIGVIWGLMREVSPAAGSEAQRRPREVPSRAEGRPSDEGAAHAIQEPTGTATASQSTEANPASQQSG